MEDHDKPSLSEGSTAKPRRPSPLKKESAEDLVDKVGWVTTPIRRRKGTYEILTCGPGQTIEVVALTSPVVLEVHWLQSRSVPHLVPPSKCEPCESGSPIRLKAYLLGAVISTGKKYLCEITENALLGCPSCFSPESFVNHKITIRRHGSKPNGRLTMKIGEVPRALQDRPIAEIDIRTAILDIFLRPGPVIDGTAQN